MQTNSYRNFRVLDSEPLTAAEHMALDEVIVEVHSQKITPNTLRFLQFKPCALVGRHQNTYLEVNVPYCQQKGIDINRRITGGGGLYWGPLELGWEMYAAKDTPGIPTKVADLYKLLCQGMLLALKKIGLEAAYRPVNDIEIAGRKIAGTGGTELGDTFVFQCSLLVDFDIEEMLRVLRLPIEKLDDKAARLLSDRVTTLSKELGFIPEHSDIKAAILAGMSQSFGYEFYQGELYPAELELFQKLLPKFKSEEWIFGLNGGILNTVDITENSKAPGGLIRVSLRLDEKITRIKYLLITGDFFAYPSRSINDLENALKNAHIDHENIAGIVNRFFLEYRPGIPGVTAAHVIAVIDAAIKKAKVKKTDPK